MFNVSCLITVSVTPNNKHLFKAFSFQNVFHTPGRSFPPKHPGSGCSGCQSVQRRPEGAETHQN